MCLCVVSQQVQLHECTSFAFGCFMLNTLIELLGRLEEETTARKAAEEQVESAEHRTSMLEFDMKQKESELEWWKQQVW